MSKAQQTILVVEDDEAIMLGLVENLKFAGYEVITADDGALGLRLALEKKPDLVLLDIMLPEMSGYDICRKLRDKGIQTPVIMLTARQDEFDKVHGFEMGADDYVTKPFSINELLARIKAVLLRGKRRSEGPKTYEFGSCELDLESRILRKRSEVRGPAVAKAMAGRQRSEAGKKLPKKDEQEEWVEVALTRTEFDLLAYFCNNEGKALSRDVVLNDVWGVEYYGTQRSLDSFVASLRGKIEEEPSKPKHILTVHGVGYKFVK